MEPENRWVVEENNSLPKVHVQVPLYRLNFHNFPGCIYLALITRATCGRHQVLMLLPCSHRLPAWVKGAVSGAKRSARSLTNLCEIFTHSSLFIFYTNPGL